MENIVKGNMAGRLKRNTNYILPIVYNLIFTMIFLSTLSHANNVQATNCITTGANAAEDYTYVQFDLSWDNSWRDDINWDAVWVFVKYQIQGDSLWYHAYLDTNSSLCSVENDNHSLLSFIK